MSRLGKGWLRNVRPFAHTFSGVHPLSLQALTSSGSDLTPFNAPLMDQGDTPECVGHATSDGAYTSFGAAGMPLLFVPSMNGIYVIANAETRAAQGLDPQTTPLTNEGSYPSDAMLGLSKVGIRPMGPRQGGRFSDASNALAIVEPSQEELEQDWTHSVESHAILEGMNVVGDLCAALTKYAVPTGIFVDTAFEDWTPMKGFIGAPVNPYDPNGGGHYVDCVGFILAGILAQQGATALPKKMAPTAAQAAALAAAAAKLPSTDPLFFFKNSWNTWGLNGYFIATKSLITARTTSDMNAILPVLKAVA